MSVSTRPFDRALTRAAGLAAALCFAIAPSVDAQQPLTLDSAIDAALANNASLGAVRAGADEARARGGEARARLLPTLRFTEAWQRGNQPVFVFSSLLSARRFTADNFAIPSLNQPAAVGFFRSTVGLEQVFFDGGRRRSAASAAQARSEVADLAVERAAADLALETTRVFGRALAARGAARAAEAGLLAAREDRARAAARRDAGTATDADVLELAVHVADLEARVIRANGEAAIADAELNRLMGAPVTNPFQVVAPAVPGERPGESLQALLDQASQSRPELRQAAARERAAGAAQREARSSLIPQVSGQAVIDATGMSVGDRSSAWLVGGELSWQLSLGGADILARRAAVASSARAAAERDDLTAAVHVEVVAAFRGLDAALARQAVGRAAVDQARETQRIIRDRFEAGLAGTQDVLRAAAAFLAADASATSAFVDVLVGQAQLRRAVGQRAK